MGYRCFTMKRTMYTIKSRHNILTIENKCWTWNTGNCICWFGANVVSDEPGRILQYVMATWELILLSFKIYSSHVAMIICFTDHCELGMNFYCNIKRVFLIQPVFFWVFQFGSWVFQNWLHPWMFSINLPMKQNYHLFIWYSNQNTMVHGSNICSVFQVI